MWGGGGGTMTVVLQEQCVAVQEVMHIWLQNATTDYYCSRILSLNRTHSYVSSKMGILWKSDKTSQAIENTVCFHTCTYILT
jgi:hypothetical protein